ncbi:MAG TPA: PQQ-binding-like beta-propeller repeat protein [Vicinamibacteria bacterium]|nr:PQQ-binding-like beta-propeller repeat protein [Vicinamibacteria bacterium]
MQHMRILTAILSSWLAAGVAAAGDVQLLPVEGEGASYWPRWRGPSGQGTVNGTGYPDRWSDKENVVWKVGVPGQGNSSPIIWGDHLFLTTAHDGGKRLSLLAFRRSDGSLLWETVVPQQGVEHAHEKNGHASATPVTDGKTIYASFGTHGLVAVNFEGKLLWQQRVGALDNYHGSAGSPILYQGSVILYQDHQGESFVAAFDKGTGDIQWRTERDAQTGWGTPIVLSTGTRDELIVSSQHAVHAYDPSNGALYWSATGNKFEVIPTPVVGHGMVFCSSGRAGPTLAIRPGGTGDVTDTNVVWSSPKGSPFVPSPIIVGDYLYMVNDMVSVVTGYEAKTGKVVFQGRLGLAEKESFSASPVTVDGKIFFTNDKGETFVLEAGPEFRLLHVNRLGARTLASPAPVEGQWYFRTEKELIAIGGS